ncbi:MAG: phage tail tube protein [Candidatus Hodarchaeota archaeon]
MATFASWQPVVGIGREQTWGTVTSLQTGNLMPAGSGIGLPLTEMPSFDSGPATIESDKFHGTSYVRTDVSERMRGILLPNTTLNFDISTDIIQPFLMTFFQRDGSTALQGGASTYTKSYIAYTADPDLASKTAYMDPTTAGSSVPMSLFLVKKTGASSEGHILQGAIARQITISGAVNEPWKASVEMIAKTMATNRDYSSDVFTFNTDAPILFQDTKFEWATTETDMLSFSITINNNAIAKTYDNQTVQKILYGKIETTGSITLPWDGANTMQDAFGGAISSNIQRFEFGNSATAITGACSADKDFYIIVPAAITGYQEIEQDGERAMEVNFEGTYDASILSSNEGSIKIICSDSLQYANS